MDYKFTDRGLQVLGFKTYCLFSKVTNINIRQAVSPYESWHCWIERWKSLNSMLYTCCKDKWEMGGFRIKARGVKAINTNIM